MLEAEQKTQRGELVCHRLSFAITYATCAKLYGDTRAKGWDSAVAIAADIPLFMVFTKGFGGNNWDALRLFDLGIHPGIRLLEEAGLASPFPHMKRWFVKDDDIERSKGLEKLQEFDRSQKPRATAPTPSKDVQSLHKLAQNIFRMVVY